MIDSHSSCHNQLTSHKSMIESVNKDKNDLKKQLECYMERLTSLALDYNQKVYTLTSESDQLIESKQNEVNSLN